MRITSILALVAAGTAIRAAGAQMRIPQPRVFRVETGTEGHRAFFGLRTAATGTARDTIGLVITSVVPGSPAERAGLEVGNRIAAINGVSLRADARDVTDAELSAIPARRLTRELARVKPGSEVELRVYRDHGMTSVTLHAADSDSLFGRRGVARMERLETDARPMLGVRLGGAGTRRDTLGVFVIGVADSTPAARAGIEEGNRIAAINGVSLRVSSEDAGDRYVGEAKAQRLQREVARLTPGSDVTLRLYAEGRFRDVRMKVARAGDLPRDVDSMILLDGGSDAGLMARMDYLPHLLDDMQMRLEDLAPELEGTGPAAEPFRRETPYMRRRGYGVQSCTQ